MSTPPALAPGSSRRPLSPASRLLRIVVALIAPLAFAPPVAGQAAEDSYRLGPKDLLTISVAEAPDFDAEERVTEDGAVTLPFLGRVEVAGLTVAQAEQRLSEALEECCVQRRATVTIELTELRSRPISIIGAVARPGQLPFSGRWTLLEALTQAAGGVAPSHGGTVYILRRSDNGLSDQIAIPVQRLLGEADPRVNVPLVAGDLVNVPAAVTVTIFCLGEVSQPGPVTFTSTDRITVLTAIAAAGGLNERASRKLVIKRQGGRLAEATEIEVDYRKVLAGKDPDVPLQEGDIIVVRESFF